MSGQRSQKVIAHRRIVEPKVRPYGGVLQHAFRHEFRLDQDEQLELLNNGASFSASAAGVPLVASDRGRRGCTHPLLDKAAQYDRLPRAKI